MGNVYMEADQVRFKNSTYHNLQTAVAAALEGGGGGGTTVVANPEGSATADLSKLQVGTTIYGIPADAADISYNNTTSGMTADDVQDAIDELNAAIPGIATTSAAGIVQPDGTTITIADGVISAVGGGGGDKYVSLLSDIVAVADDTGTASVTLNSVNVTMQGHFTVPIKRISYTGSSSNYGFVGLFSSQKYDISKIKRVVMNFAFNSDPSLTSDTYGYQYKMGFTTNQNAINVTQIVSAPISQINKPYDAYDNSDIYTEHMVEFIVPDNMPSSSEYICIAFLANKNSTVVQNILSLYIEMK